MSYDEKQREREVELPQHERLVQLFLEIGERMDEVEAILERERAKWPLAHGEVGVITTPTNPPQVLCIRENEESHHWIMQSPCGGRQVYDFGTIT
jgi:hypothetical protein